MSLLDFLGISKFSTSVRYSIYCTLYSYECTVANVQARPLCIGFQFQTLVVGTTVACVGEGVQRKDTIAK